MTAAEKTAFEHQWDHNDTDNDNVLSAAELDFGRMNWERILI